MVADWVHDIWGHTAALTHVFVIQLLIQYRPGLVNGVLGEFFARDQPHDTVTANIYTNRQSQTQQTHTRTDIGTNTANTDRRTHSHTHSKHTSADTSHKHSEHTHTHTQTQNTRTQEVLSSPGCAIPNRVHTSESETVTRTSATAARTPQRPRL